VLVWRAGLDAKRGDGFLELALDARDLRGDLSTPLTGHSGSIHPKLRAILTGRPLDAI